MTLHASGNVGNPAASLRITNTALHTKDGLTNEQKGALALATAPGDVTFYGTINGTNTEQEYTFGNKPANVTFVGIRVAQTAPFFVKVLDRLLQTNAGQAVFLQSTLADLVLGQVQAGGNVSLTAPHSILSNGGVTTNGDLRLLAGSGDVGEAAAPLNITVNGILTSANAGGNIYLRNSGDLNFDRIVAGGNVLLQTPTGGLFQHTPGTGIVANALTVTAQTNVGTAVANVNAQLASSNLIVTTPVGQNFLRRVNSVLAPTTMTLVSSSGSSIYSKAVTFTATVRSSGTGATTGTVNFYVDGALYVGGTPVSSGVASFNISVLGVGQHNITAVYSDVTNTYATSQNAVNQTITKATLTITPNANQFMSYGATVPSLAYTVSGLVNGDMSSIITGSLGTSATSTSSVGSYAIKIGNLSAGANYQVQLAANPPTFAVRPATLYIRPTDNQSKLYGAAVPSLTYTASGLVNGDTSSIIRGSLGTRATSTSNVGHYAFTLNNLSAGPNYQVALAARAPDARQPHDKRRCHRRRNLRLHLHARLVPAPRLRQPDQ